MGLYQRITATGATKIGVHRFSAALQLWAAANLTRAQVIAAFSLDAAATTELDALRATYDALPTNNTANTLAKALFLDKMHSVFLLCETGDLTEQQAKTFLGF